MGERHLISIIELGFISSLDRRTTLTANLSFGKSFTSQTVQVTCDLLLNHLQCILVSVNHSSQTVDMDLTLLQNVTALVVFSTVGSN